MMYGILLTICLWEEAGVVCQEYRAAPVSLDVCEAKGPEIRDLTVARLQKAGLQVQLAMVSCYRETGFL